MRSASSKRSPRRETFVLSADTPAIEFAEGCPIGNGRIGMMCFGGPAKPMFAINHFDLWYRPRVQAKPMPGYFRVIRRNALAGNWPPVNKAMTIAFDSWKVTPDGSFQPGALLELWFQSSRHLERKSKSTV